MGRGELWEGKTQMGCARGLLLLSLVGQVISYECVFVRKRGSDHEKW